MQAPQRDGGSPPHHSTRRGGRLSGNRHGTSGRSEARVPTAPSSDSAPPVPFARSETHLSELLDSVCEKMNDYAPYLDPDTQEQHYKRFAPRSNDRSGFPDFNNFKFDGGESSPKLVFACETLAEELEEDIISALSKDVDNVHDHLCSNISGYCTHSGRTNDEL